ncbi:hypothetical protein PR002_g1856 [Phytophthora rubi]|uniref:Uncharacterized protein n=1 Tax=Phytophthora rubi TaxID=129364 RepID=A0A6A3NSG8_9STRA|nr:hypothetical protein PR002_g1856 [Phytophthora rubi]
MKKAAKAAQNAGQGDNAFDRLSKKRRTKLGVVENSQVDEIYMLCGYCPAFSILDPKTYSRNSSSKLAPPLRAAAASSPPPLNGPGPQETTSSSKFAAGVEETRAAETSSSSKFAAAAEETRTAETSSSSKVVAYETGATSSSSKGNDETKWTSFGSNGQNLPRTKRLG